MKAYEAKPVEQLQLFEGGEFMEAKQPKAVPAKRVDIVQIKLVREKTMLYKERRIRSPHDAYELAKDFLGDVDREHFVIIIKIKSTSITEK